MGARLKTKLYTIGTAPASLSTIINSSPDEYVSSVTVRAGRSNAGDIFWYDSGATEKGGYLDAHEAATIDLSGKFVKSTELYFGGTENDTIYLTVIG